MRMARIWSAALLVTAACGRATGSTEWSGTMDTLPSGRVVVTNPARGVWGPDAAWQVIEEIRIGAEDGSGPEVLGQITALAEDAGGRIWALEAQDQSFKVFAADGRFIRTVGRKGGGPGEMQQVSGVAQTREGHLLVVDPRGARISLFDTAGTFLRSFTVSAGFQMFPWPGGIDTAGYLYNVAPRPGTTAFEIVLVRYDSAMTPLDTLVPPRFAEREYFEHSTRSGSVRASVPFTPSLLWQLTPQGDFWFVLTGSYQLFRQNARGDTIRVVTKPFQPVPVTGAEKDSAVARLKWFTDQGGSVDRGRLPYVKPAVQGFLLDEDGYLWVNPVQADTSLQNRVFDIFDPEGRYLGQLKLSFELHSYPAP
ncbi:MAG TPA: 6-bladed beta-propeller, partial [Candidatus Binatia bacterium]|nr:6-bladed beta-propeller [Candidatus Binatia bacterium]